MAVIYIVLLQQCGGEKCPAVEISGKDTLVFETVYDTTWHDTTRYHDFPVPKAVAYYDTVWTELVDSSGLVTLTPRLLTIYEDSITDDTIAIRYRLSLFGEIDKVTLGYKVLSPYYIKESTTLETEVTKIIRPRSTHLFIGADFGGTINVIHIVPEITFQRKKAGYSLGYDVIDKSIMIGLKQKVF